MKNTDSIYLYLRIAGFNIKINLNKTQFLAERKRLAKIIVSHYHGFIPNEKPKRINYFIRFAQMEEFYMLFKKNGSRFLLFFIEDKKKQITTFYHISFKQFELILHRVINTLLRNNGFILHASASNINQEAYIFTGKSGAGKSTIMKLLAKKYPPLADDSIIIKKEKQNFYFYQTPFTEKEDGFKRGLEKYKIRKIFFLRKAGDLRVEKINNRQYILERVIKQFWSTQEHLPRQTKIFFEFFSRFNVFYFLYFPKSERARENFNRLKYLT